MLRFIWQNWWRNKQRFLLLLIGALIISSGLSYLVGLSETNKATIIDTLEKKWGSSYDIVVRPQGTRSVTEDKKLLEPNYLSGISGGITLQQYDAIKKIKGVDIAAPISMIGYVLYTVPFKDLNITKPGVYRLTQSWISDIGPKKVKDGGTIYFTVGPWAPDGTGKEYGTGVFDQKLSASVYVLLAGIDPAEESRLVGLDKSVLNDGKNHYFSDTDVSTLTKPNGGRTFKSVSIPVLMSKHEYVDETFKYKVEKLDLPFDNIELAKESMKKVKANGGKAYLDTIKSSDTKTYTYTSQKAHDLLVKMISNGTSVTKEQLLIQKPSPLQFSPVSSPFPERWPFAYQIQPSMENAGVIDHPTYRKPSTFGKDSSTWPRLKTNFIGVYDPTKLKISKDPLTKLPMETYFPADAKLVLTPDGEPVNPPETIKPIDQPYSYLTKPPVMLTTLDGATKILGDKPISSIRVKVTGVKHLTEKSQKKLEAVAKEIRDKTGLITDITLGSSPQPALMYVPKVGNQESLGWVEQPWVKIGSSFVLFKETKMGFSGVIASVILVAILYVFATSLIAMYTRRKEYAVLLAMGWRPEQVSRLILTESAILGCIVALVSWIILGWIGITHNVSTSFIRVFLIGVFGLAIYLLGAIIPAILVTKIRPYEAIQTGEVSKHARILPTRNWISMAFNQMAGQWKRGLLTIITIALPASLLGVFLVVSLRLKGEMFTTLLGHYTALEVGPRHYLAIGIALLIAILTTAEILWQNVSERQPELALLKAVGWRHSSIRALVLAEGAFSGFIGGVIGWGISVGILWLLYQHAPVEQMLFLVGTMIVPVFVGLLGAYFPAQQAVKLTPNEGFTGRFNNNSTSEKRLKLVLYWSGGALIIIFMAMIVYFIPVSSKSDVISKHQATPQKIDQTVGKINVNSDESTQQVTSPQEPNSDKKFYEVALGNLFQPSKMVPFSLEFERVKAPEQAKLPPPTEGKTYVSVQITVHNDVKGSYLYQPYYYELKSRNHFYKPKSFTIIKNKGWEHDRLTSHGQIVSVLTYLVPSDSHDLKLTVYGDFTDKKISVSIGDAK
jgi:ABC-type lipoprotein release transport system permease subunit